MMHEQDHPAQHRIRVGIVGCGNIAGNHADGYQALPGVDVVACCDIDPARAAHFAAEHGIPVAVSAVDELLDLGLDLISVCTPHPTHEAVVVAAAGRGVHVLCEKPIAISLDSAERMVAVCDDAGVLFGAVFQRRYWPAARRIRDAIDSGLLGQPILGRCSVLLHREPDYYTATAWRGTWETDGGGVLMTQAIHNVDLLQWYMGPVVEVNATSAAFKHGAYMEVEDTIVATLKFESGALATVEASTALTPGLGTSVTVTGSNGATVGLAEFPEGAEAINDIWAVPGEVAYRNARDANVPDLTLAAINGALAPFHRLQIADFVAAVRDGREPAVTGRSASAALRIVLALYESCRSGRPVSIEAPVSARTPSIRSRKVLS